MKVVLDQVDAADELAIGLAADRMGLSTAAFVAYAVGYVTREILDPPTFADDCSEDPIDGDEWMHA